MQVLSTSQRRSHFSTDSLNLAPLQQQQHSGEHQQSPNLNLRLLISAPVSLANAKKEPKERGEMALTPRHGHSKSHDALLVPTTDVQGAASTPRGTSELAQVSTECANQACGVASSSRAATSHGESAPLNADRFSLLPDELVVEILARLGGSAADVSVASMTCRRWSTLAKQLPCLSFGTGNPQQRQVPSPARFEESISRMVLRSQFLRQLSIVTPLPAASPAGGCGAECGTSASAAPASCGCGCCGTEAAHGAAVTAEEDSASARHPREFIFEAWMRHVGPSLRSLTLSRAVPATASSHCGGGDGGRSVVVNLWEEEDASLHLAHISRHCTSLRSLSLGHVSLSAPTLLAALQPMPALQHLSLSWLHASPAALHAVLDAAPNLRSLTIFMASGFPRLHVRLPASLEHISLSYIRADSVALRSAHSLQSVSLRDMFLRALSIRDAPNLRQLAIASANSLLVSAPHSNGLAQIDLRAGSLNWPAIESLISSNSAALESLSLDFFAVGSGSGLPSVSSLPWLARNCPRLRSLRLGVLAWQNMVGSAAESGLLQSHGRSASFGTLNGSNLWPRLEELKVRVEEKGPEGLLLLHLILSNTPTLMNLHVTVEGEDEDEEEEEEEMEYEGDCDAMSIDENQEDEGKDEEGEAANISPSHPSAEAPAPVSADPSACHHSSEASPARAKSTQSVGYWPALTAAERQHQLFLKGLDCLQRRFGCFHVTSPVLLRRETF
ncbi:hypothetical protein CLOM_g21622 [Closterium sp. NIES-68]|nr:hypothetical protein CLOM_g21622 [Closterium sp. NIES-68]GJP72932.1 hypothetical protein CLOP_g3700 [Closterium sp. NIES-67]